MIGGWFSDKYFADHYWHSDYWWEGARALIEAVKKKFFPLRVFAVEAAPRSFSFHPSRAYVLEAARTFTFRAQKRSAFLSYKDS